MDGMELRTEDEIISSWRLHGKGFLVSICCIAYNQEKYIEEALKSFLIQETIFPIEILIHDDASTDGTRKIIEEYVTLYPRLIKPIYQEKNQYRNCKVVNFKFNFPRAEGRYIALCEGDDYWLSKNKLQVQFDALEKDSSASMSAHAVDFLFDDVVEERKNYNVPSIVEGNFKQIVTRGIFMAFNSLFFRRELLEYPNWLFKLSGGHKFLVYLMASKGSLIYLNEAMAVKRRNQGGVTVKYKSERQKKYMSNNIFLLENLREFLDEEQTAIVNKRLSFLCLRFSYMKLKRLDILGALCYLSKAFRLVF